MLQTASEMLGAGPGAVLTSVALLLALVGVARPGGPTKRPFRLLLFLPALVLHQLDTLMLTLTSVLHTIAGATAEVPLVAAGILVAVSWPTIRVLNTAILPCRGSLGPLFFAIGILLASATPQPAALSLVSAVLALWADTVPRPERGWFRAHGTGTPAMIYGSFIGGLWLSSGWISLRTVFEPSLAGVSAVAIGVAFARLILPRVPALLWSGLIGVTLWILPHGLESWAPSIAAAAVKGDLGLSGTLWLQAPLVGLGALIGPLIRFGPGRDRAGFISLALGLSIGPWIATHATTGWIGAALLCIGATFASHFWTRSLFVLGAAATLGLLGWMKPADVMFSRLGVWAHASNPKTLSRWASPPKGLSAPSHGQTEGGAFVAWSGQEESGLTLDGLTALTQGRQAAAEELSGHLAILAAPVREPLLILGDWAGNALRAISAYPKGLAQISVPTAHGLRALAASDPVRERLWLQPNHSLYAEAPARLVQRMPQLPTVIEISHAPWTDGANWGLSGRHIRTIKSRLIQDGVYVLCVHLRWWPERSISKIARALTDNFKEVQIWLPPEGVDSLIFVSSDSPLNPGQMSARFGHAKASLEALGYPNSDSLAGAAVLGSDALRALADEADGLFEPTRLPTAVLERPSLHVSDFPARMERHADPWSGLGNNAIANVRQARGTLLQMVSKANQGEIEGAFQAAQSLAEHHGELGISALESLIAPHIRDGRAALKRAIHAGPAAAAWDDAARFATTARMLAPKSHIPATLLGDIALAKGHLPKALERYQFALTVAPTHIPALEGLARWARLSGETSRAEQALRSGTRHEPRNWRTWHNLGVFLLEQERTEEALSAIETSLGLAPIEEPAPLLALTTGLLRNNQPGSALLRADQLTKLDSELGLAWFLRGRAHFDLNRLDEAEEDFRKSVLTDANLIEARSGIGLVRAIVGDHDSAAQIFRDVLKRDPENMAARENLRRLGAKDKVSP